MLDYSSKTLFSYHMLQHSWARNNIRNTSSYDSARKYWTLIDQQSNQTRHNNDIVMTGIAFSSILNQSSIIPLYFAIASYKIMKL